MRTKTNSTKLSESEAKLRLAELARDMMRADKAYHADDAPVISDAEYDALKAENLALEQAFPKLVREDSASQRVGTAVSSRYSPIPEMQRPVHCASLIPTSRPSGL